LTPRRLRALTAALIAVAITAAAIGSG
jgi:hypothetical protein